MHWSGARVSVISPPRERKGSLSCSALDSGHGFSWLETQGVYSEHFISYTNYQHYLKSNFFLDNMVKVSIFQSNMELN